MKKCTKCKLDKDESCYVKDKHTASGLTARCKECRGKDFKKWYRENPELVKELRKKDREYRKDYYSSPERKLKYRKAYIEKAFNIKYSLYEELQNKQNNVCAICSRPETSSRNKYLTVDHCHVSGKIRGLLCTSCNRALGLFRDNTGILKQAINYLERN